MSYDGWPPNLQSFCSKICLRSQNSWTLMSKTHFSLYRHVKLRPRAPKSVPKVIKTHPAKHHIGVRIILFGARFFIKLNGFWVPEIRCPIAPVRGPNWTFVGSLKSSYFCAFNFRILMNHPINYIKSVY